jgi:hypothetical protein
MSDVPLRASTAVNGRTPSNGSIVDRPLVFESVELALAVRSALDVRHGERDWDDHVGLVKDGALAEAPADELIASAL